MRMLGKKGLLLLLIGCLLFSSAAKAEFSPRYTELQGREHLQVELGATFDTLSPLSAQTLEIINDWLTGMRLRLSISSTATGTLERGEITQNGAELYGVTLYRQPTNTLTFFSSSGGSYLTNAKEKDALSLLVGASAMPLPLTFAADLYSAWAPALYPLLSELTTAKASKTSTSVKNATASASYVNYTFKPDEMNAAWPRILSTLLPVLEEALDPALYCQAEALLSPLVFSGECRFKRLLDKQGNDMGLQFTGNAALGDDVRKVTLFGGYTADKGGYISLALPAVKGKNNFKVSLTGKLTVKDNQRTLALEAAYTRKYEDDSRSISLEGSLKNTIKDKDEAWSGKLTLTDNQNGVSDVWTLSPVLSFDESGLQGNIALRQKRDKETLLQGALMLHLRTSVPLEPPVTLMTAKDLRTLSEENARAVVSAEIVPLTRAFMQLLAPLPEESRALLTHDLRTDAWMNAPARPLDPAQSSTIDIMPYEDASLPFNLEEWTVEDDPWAGETY